MDYFPRNQWNMHFFVVNFFYVWGCWGKSTASSLNMRLPALLFPIGTSVLPRYVCDYLIHRSVLSFSKFAVNSFSFFLCTPPTWTYHSWSFKHSERSWTWENMLSPAAAMLIIAKPWLALALRQDPGSVCFSPNKPKSVCKRLFSDCCVWVVWEETNHEPGFGCAAMANHSLAKFN